MSSLLSIRDLTSKSLVRPNYGIRFRIRLHTTQYKDQFICGIRVRVKLRIHLSIIWMPMMNANVTKIECIELVQEWFHVGKCECELQIANVTNWIAPCSDWCECDVLLDRKSLHTHGRCRVAQAWPRENCTGALNAFIIRLRYSYLHYAQGES